MWEPLNDADPWSQLAVLGANAKQRAGFLWTEARAIVIARLVGGLVTGALISSQLIKVLNGIFDPAPQHPAIPWTFLATVVATVVLAGAIATTASARWAGRVDATRLRDL